MINAAKGDNQIGSREACGKVTKVVSYSTYERCTRDDTQWQHTTSIIRVLRAVEMSCKKIEKAMLHDLGRRELPGGWVSLNQSNVDSLQVFVEKSGCRFKVQS